MIIRACAERLQLETEANKSGEHQPGHGEIDKRLAAGMRALKIAREPTIVRDPGVRALDDPSSRKNMEALGNDLVPIDFCADRSICALDASPGVIHDFHTDIFKVLFDPLLKCPLIGTIGPNKPETREISDQECE